MISADKRNRLVYGLALLFLFFAIISWPIEPLDRFTQDTTAVFNIGAGNYVEYPNGTTKGASVVAYGFIKMTGKGGLSAGNPLSIEVILYVNESALGFKPSRVAVLPLDASPYPTSTNAEGFPMAVAIVMTKLRESKWYGTGRMIYNQAGNMKWEIDFDDVSVISTETIQIESGAVTVAARTNSLLISLTWVILLFTVLELRVEKQGYEPQESSKSNSNNRDSHH